jgi:hypothetical protein
MAQADHLTNAIRAPITGAGAKPSTARLRAVALLTYLTTIFDDTLRAFLACPASGITDAPVTRSRLWQGGSHE